MPELKADDYARKNLQENPMMITMSAQEGASDSASPLSSNQESSVSEYLIETPDSSLRAYLQEVGTVPLLTPDDERTLAGLIKAGDMPARELMIKANLRLVVKIAHDYEGYGLPLLDLINEGNIGLMKAVDRFDPAKGAKFSTYGAFWIKQAIKRGLANQSKTIRLPVYLVREISQIRRTTLALHEELGREPSDEELACELGMSYGRLLRIKTAALRPASLDSPIGDDESANLSDIIADDKAESPDTYLAEKALMKLLPELLKTLNSREITILRERFGLESGKEKTLEEIGVILGITRERIRQLQNNALRKLRSMVKRYEALGDSP